jgi:gliding motility-associated-like protein
MKFIQITFLLLFTVTLAIAQPTNGRIAYYSFDNCDATDETGNGSNGTLFGMPDCDCGVKGQALSFDGIDDYAVFNGVINSVFQTQDFTISFYFKAKEAATSVQDIFSKRTACDQNTMFNVEYIQALNFMTVDLVEQGNGSSFLTANGAETCWHHCMIVRDGQEVELYLDNVLKMQTSTPNLLNLDNSASLTLGNSPCINQTVSRFTGLIDELYVYNIALRPDQMVDFNLTPDMIGNSDTILFTGNSLETYVNNTCATDFLWSPTDNVLDPTSATTTITPEDTATYVLRITDDNFCITYDTLTINVINPDDLPCDQVFLPKAFTPNDDGRNETFGISNPEIVQQLQIFEVYDRWGSRVFVTDNPYEKWDATFRNKAVNPGVYVWKIEYECEGESKIETGNVTIIR